MYSSAMRTDTPLSTCWVMTDCALSAALEALQFALSTGMTDIDDVLLNALGALLGACAVRILRRQGLLRSESPTLRIQ